MASGQPQRVSLWNKLYGPLTFDLSPNAEGYGLAFLLLSGLATIGFMLRSMRVSGFHGAGRMTPGVYAGLSHFQFPLFLLLSR
jgi:hypothetical protein